MKNELKVSTPGDRDITLTRTFDAPRRRVYDAHTRPELVQRWLLGPPGWTMPHCEIDLKPGGRFRYLWQHADGRKMGLSGVYRELTPGERIIHTEQFDDDWTAGETLVTTVFTEQGGKTLMTSTIRYASKEAREGALRTGMESGLASTYDLLEKLLGSQTAQGSAQVGA